MARIDGRTNEELRPSSITLGYQEFAEGSVLVQTGLTRVICSASIEEKVPQFLRGRGRGWITAEYGMLPRSTHTRGNREAARGKQSGRTQEIQRLIGRSLRAITDMKALGENQITIDCDVIQADGGTRTASITGGYVALALACKYLVDEGVIERFPLTAQAAAISCGIYKGVPVLDLDYPEDSEGEVDANFVMTSDGNIIEIQGTGEARSFTPDEFAQLMALANKGCGELFNAQKDVLGG